MKTIIINSKKHGKYNVLVDDEDYTYLSKINWFLRYNELARKHHGEFAYQNPV